MSPQKTEDLSGKKSKVDEVTKQPQQTGAHQEQLSPEQLVVTKTNNALEQYQYPFENLVFQGGYNKLLAYSGAVKVSSYNFI